MEGAQRRSVASQRSFAESMSAREFLDRGSYRSWEQRPDGLYLTVLHLVGCCEQILRSVPNLVSYRVAHRRKGAERLEG
jgi:hypothetical protein